MLIHTANSFATAALLLLGQGGMAAPSETAKMKREFMKAMRSSPDAQLAKRKKIERRAKSEQKISSDEQLRQKIIEKATYVSPEEVKKREQRKESRRIERILGGDDANDDANDDQYIVAGEWSNAYGFDATGYSISYSRCAEVRQFDEEIAAQEDTDRVFSTKHFAIFRFCPALTCDGYDRARNDECEEGDEDCEEQANGQYQGNGNYYQGNAAGNGRNGYNQAYGMQCDGEDCEQEEEEQVWGANGEGCQSNYGEYMLELEDYLAIVQEYREERMEVYCDYCEDCMYKVYKQWLNSQGRRDLLAVTDEGWRRELEHVPVDEVRKLGGCPEYERCKVYNNICGNNDDEYAEYFECTEVERDNGMVAYLGPHCAQDGETITIGIYADENCDEYIGNSVDIRNWLGDDIDEDALVDYYNPEDEPCIPCRAADQMYEGSQYQYGDAEENWGDDEITTLCQEVYNAAARCDKHYRSYSNKAKYAKKYNKAYMDLSCDFIESVVAENYDELGYVRIDTASDCEGEEECEDALKRNFLTDNMYYEEYGHYVDEVTPMQIFGLVASILACSLLALWSCALHNSLTKKAPWRPRRGMQAAAPPSGGSSVSRQNSGIVMGRSRSGGSYYMT